jgi:hypothetical protein
MLLIDKGEKTRKNTSYENYVSIYLIIMSFEYITEYYVTIGNSIMTYINTILKLVVLFYPLILLKYHRPKLTGYRLYFLFVFGIVMLITIYNLIFNYKGNVSYIFIYESMFTAYLMSKINEDVLLRSFKKIAFFAFIALIYVFIFVGVDLSAALRRGYSWSEIFYYASIFWAVIPFVILANLKGKYTVLSTFYWIGAVLINLLLLKRFILVDSLLLLCMLLVIGLTNNKKLFIRVTKLTTLIITISLTIVFAFNEQILPLIASISDRFAKVDDLSNFDRFVESGNYLSTITLGGLIFGKGFLGTHTGLDHIAYALHSGWINFILKGGIMLLSVVLIPYFKVLRLIPFLKEVPIKQQFSICFLLIYAFRLSYVNMHAFYPEMLLFFYCVFSVMDYRVHQRG